MSAMLLLSTRKLTEMKNDSKVISAATRVSRYLNSLEIQLMLWQGRLGSGVIFTLRE